MSLCMPSSAQSGTEAAADRTDSTMDNPYLSITETKVKELTEGQAALHTALIKLMENHKISDLSVREVCSEAGVARSTFYYYYQSIDDILEEIEDQLIGTLISQNEKIMSKEYSSEEDLHFYQQTMDFVNEHHEIFEIFLITNPDYRFQEKWKNAIKYHLWERLPSFHRADYGQLVFEITAASTLSAYIHLFKNPGSIKIESIYSVIAEFLKTLDRN